MVDYGEFREDNPLYQIKILANEVDGLRKEKEALERRLEATDKRVSDVEKSLSRGIGALLAFPVFGTIMGILIAYGKYIFGGKGQ